MKLSYMKEYFNTKNALWCYRSTKQAYQSAIGRRRRDGSAALAADRRARYLEPAFANRIRTGNQRVAMNPPMPAIASRAAGTAGSEKVNCRKRADRTWLKAIRCVDSA
jgi:hypothetical protein